MKTSIKRVRLFRKLLQNEDADDQRGEVRNGVLQHHLKIYLHMSCTFGKTGLVGVKHRTILYLHVLSSITMSTSKQCSRTRIHTTPKESSFSSYTAVPSVNGYLSYRKTSISAYMVMVPSDL